jgi:hypothetical protein
MDIKFYQRPHSTLKYTKVVQITLALGDHYVGIIGDSVAGILVFEVRIVFMNTVLVLRPQCGH